MYRPAFHREDDLDKQHALIRARPLGLLVSSGPGGLMASPAPFVLRAGASKSGVLALHLARANPQWRDLDKGGEPLAVFQDADAYVSPSWYATKRETGKVVPTWNYAAVHAWGRARVIHDSGWLRALVTELTDQHESGREEPWKVTDAPADYIDSMLGAIVGVEIEITRIEGKWKMSQNRARPDREGVAAGLRAQGDDASRRVADLIEAAAPGPGERG
jgi:transcriptional regulator